MLIIAAASLVSIPISYAETPAPAAKKALILVYHRFGATAADSMTVSIPVFEWQLRYLRDNRYVFVPLRKVVEFVDGHGQIPQRAVAITVDDGHRSVFSEMKPLVERYRIPVTLFIYPSAISNAPYAMTWEELRALKQTGLFDIESHTYWHPNFAREKKRLSRKEFEKFVHEQLLKPRLVLRTKLGVNADMLAWPFGIHDDELERTARSLGYVAGFTLKRRPVTKDSNVMALPRYLVTDQMRGRAFENTLHADASQASEH